MATGKLIPLIQQRLGGLLDSIPEVKATTPPMRPAPAFANEPQGNSMQGNMPLLPNVFPQQDSNGFEPMKPGGGRFVGEAQDNTPWYKNQNLMDSLALGFNSMRLNPDQGLAGMIQARQKTASELAVGTKTAQAVIAQLRKMGENDAADMVTAQPSIAKDVLTQIIQAKYAKAASPTASGVQTDTKTGQIYQVVFNPSTGKNERVDVPGAVGDTPSAVAARASSLRLTESGQKMAQDKGAAVFGRASGLGEQIGKLKRASELVGEGGAQTGVIRALLPSFNSATAELRSIANGLGIDIINSATFGALSEKELSLALSTGLDTSLQGAALSEHIQDKINAQEKLYNQLMDDARELSGGITYNEYIQRRTSRRRESPLPSYGGGVQLPPELQGQMSQDQIEAFKKLSPDMQQKFIGAQ